jgi:hypothetical protein
VVWFVVALVFTFAARPTPWLLLACGVFLGAVAGALQLRAIRQSPSAFLTSTSLLDVRRAMTATAAGRLYVYFFWGSAIALVALAAFVFGNGFLLSWAASYCILAFTRESVAMRGVIELESMAVAALRENSDAA